MKLFLLLLPLAMTAGLAARAQVGIGTTTPDPKAILELKAPDKGLLIPRLTATQRTNLTSVPQGLLVYQTDGTAGGGAQTGFWYYGGSGGWVFLNTNAGLTLAYSGSYGGDAATTAFAVSHTNDGVAVSGSSTTNAGVYGSSGNGAGVYGTATASSGYGVRGATTASNSAGLFGTASGTNTFGAIGSGETGVQGQGGSGPGLSGLSLSGQALLAAKSGSQTGRVAELTLAGTSNDSTAVYVSSVGARPALRAINSNTSAQAAVRGVKTAGTNGIGVEGVVTSGGGNAAGVLGRDLSSTSAGSGVVGRTTAGFGVQGLATASGGWGVYGQATDSYGIIGSSNTGNGVYGTTGANSNTTAGVQGVGTSGNNAVGVLGLAQGGYGVRGEAAASPGAGVYGKGTGTYGVYGTSDTGRGVYGSSTSSYGVQGYSTSSYGVYGTTGATSTSGAAGVIGSGSSGGVGVLGSTTTGYAVQGTASSGSGFAGYFTGNVQVVGTLAKSGGSFKIDHPLDPENQYLSHSFVESPDMLNVYNGNVTLDARGEATVELPDYFEALNRDFRYQLTPIGAAFTPYVKEEVSGNKFRIAGQPGGKVSWQVTGIRQDKWANQNRIPNAAPKEPENRGKYLHPAAYGLPAERGIGYRPVTPAAHPAPTAAR